MGTRIDTVYVIMTAAHIADENAKPGKIILICSHSCCDSYGNEPETQYFDKSAQHCT